MSSERKPPKVLAGKEFLSLAKESAVVVPVVTKLIAVSTVGIVVVVPSILFLFVFKVPFTTAVAAKEELH